MSKLTKYQHRILIAPGFTEPLAESWCTERDQAAGVTQRMAVVKMPIICSNELCGDACPHHGEYPGTCTLTDPNGFGCRLEDNPVTVEGESPRWRRSEACKQGEAQLER